MNQHIMKMYIYKVTKLYFIMNFVLKIFKIKLKKYLSMKINILEKIVFDLISKIKCFKIYSKHLYFKMYMIYP